MAPRLALVLHGHDHTRRNYAVTSVEDPYEQGSRLTQRKPRPVHPSVQVCVVTLCPDRNYYLSCIVRDEAEDQWCASLRRPENRQIRLLTRNGCDTSRRPGENDEAEATVPSGYGVELRGWRSEPSLKKTAPRRLEVKRPRQDPGDCDGGGRQSIRGASRSGESRESGGGRRTRRPTPHW